MHLYLKIPQHLIIQMEEPGLTSSHANTADVLLSQEVPDLDQRASLLDDHIDGEMGVHRAHLVPEALGGET